MTFKREGWVQVSRRWSGLTFTEPSCGEGFEFSSVFCNTEPKATRHTPYPWIMTENTSIYILNRIHFQRLTAGVVICHREGRFLKVSVNISLSLKAVLFKPKIRIQSIYAWEQVCVLHVCRCVGALLGETFFACIDISSEENQISVLHLFFSASFICTFFSFPSSFVHSFRSHFESCHFPNPPPAWVCAVYSSLSLPLRLLSFHSL